MCRVPVKLRELVKQRLAAAAEEIFELLERTIAEYEEELISKYEEQRQQGALYSPDRGPLSVGASDWDPEEGPHFKEEQEEESSGQEALHSDIIRSQLCSDLKTEEQLSDRGPLSVGASDWDPEEGPHFKEEQEEESSGQEALHSDIIRSQLCSDLKTEEQLSESEEASGVSVKTEEDAWTQPVPQNQTVDCPGPKQDWTQPSAPEHPPGGARLHRDFTPKHKRARASTRLRECPLCNLRFQSNFNLETHMRVHTGERPFSCAVCGKTFNRKDSMVNHMKIHSGERSCCSVCGKRYSDKSNLRRHFLSTHRRKVT